MKFLFVYKGRYHIRDTLTIEYLSSIAKNYGHQTELFYEEDIFGITDNVVYNNFLNKVFSKDKSAPYNIIKRKPQIVVFLDSFNRSEFNRLLSQKLKIIKKDFSTVLISVFDRCDEEDSYDYVLIGEAEFVFEKFLQEKIFESKGGRYSFKGLVNLETLPFPDKTLFSAYVNFKDSYMIYTSKGCLYSCSYCEETIYKDLFGYYIKLLVLPINLCAEISFTIPSSFFDKDVFISLFLILITFFVLFKLFKKSKLATFGLLWIFITLLPASGIIFLEGRPIAEQRLYIPSLGFCLALAILLEKMFISKRYIVRRVGFISFIGLITIYSGITIKRNFDWKDPITFWKRTVSQAGNSYRAFYNLGNQYFYNKEYENAIDSYKKAIELKHDHLLSYINLGVTYQVLGRNIDALNTLYKGAEISKPAVEIWLNLTTIYKSMGDLGKALECIKKAIEINSDFAILYDRLGIFIMNLKIKIKH